MLNEPQRIAGTKLGVAVGTFVPPTSGGVDEWVALNFGIVCVGEIVDPANNGCGVQVVAIFIVRVVCQMKGECDLVGVEA